MSSGADDRRALLLRTPLPDGRHEVGTGTLIAERLVLTAAHVVFGDDGAPLEGVRIGQALAIETPDWSNLSDAAVIWPREFERDPVPGRALDLALVRITDPDWGQPKGLSGQVRFGVLTGRVSGFKVEAIGYPRALRAEDGARIAEQISATVNPSAARNVGRYDLNVTSSHPFETDGWCGFSGAGVFANGLLAAVVVVDAAGYRHSRLPAIPVSRLLQVEEVREVLRARGIDCRVQSAELSELINFGRARERYRSPAALLRPEERVVKFFGRDAVMTQLTDWCADGHRLVDVTLITGPGGQGKTRLAQELVAYHAERGWVSGFLRSAPANERTVYLRPIVDTASHVPGILLVADYAETRADQIDRLLTLLAETDDFTPLRLLLLARSSGRWWNDLRGNHPGVLGHIVPIGLGGLGQIDEVRSFAFGSAIRSFVADGILSDVYPGYDWAAIAGGIALSDDLQDPAYNSPLTLHLNALTSLLRAAQVIPEGELGSPEGLLMAHEERYWNDSADAAGLPFKKSYQRILLSYFVAAANLFGARSEADALHLISRLPGWNQNHEVARGVAKWLHGLYPPDDDRQYWGTLQPDRLAEYHLNALAREQGDLLEMLFQNASLEEGLRAVPLLTRAARHHDGLIRQLTDLLRAEDLPCREILIPVMQEVTLPLRRSNASLDLSRQNFGYTLTTTSARRGSGWAGGI